MTKRACLLAALALLLPLAQAGELADLLAATLNHPQVEATRLQRQSAEAQAAAQDGRRWGQGGVSAGWRRYEGPHVLGYYAPGTGPLPPTDRDIASLGVNWSLPVDLAGVIAAGRERARGDLAAARLAETQQQLLKLHQAASAWLNLQALGERSKALAAYRRRVEATHARLTQEIHLGKTAAVEGKNADSELARLAAEQAALDGRILEARASLAEASGREVSREVERMSGDIGVPAWMDSPPESTLPARLADSRAEAAAAQSREARRALYPRLDLVADYNEHFGAGTNRDTWSVGLAASLPLGATPYRSAEAQALAAEAVGAGREAARREATRQLASLKAAYDAAQADAAAVDQEIAYREDVVRVQHEMARLGAQTLENLFRHERDLLDARSRRAEAQARAASAWSAAQVVIGTPPETYIASLDPK